MTDHHPHPEFDGDDPLAPARGVLVGLALTLLLWGLLVAVLLWVA